MACRLRVRPKTSCGITELSEHQSDGGKAEESERIVVEVFPVLGQTAAATQPGDSAFDNPSFGQDDEAFGTIGTADDFGDEARHEARQTVVEHRPGVGAIGKQRLEKRELSEHRGQEHQPTVAILNIGRGNKCMQQQTERIDEDVAFLAFDQLAGIKSMGIDETPPFSALSRSGYRRCRRWGWRRVQPDRGI
jgi:hypothetical protein